MTKIPKLFEELEKQKITPAKLSADTGISPGNISDWKSGRSKPSAAKLAILSQYLNVSTDYLLGIKTSEELQKGCDFMSTKLTKDEILTLAKEKGVKISYLNKLIGGYRGKLTDWKNGKTTLNETELSTITDYLLGTETSEEPLDETDQQILMLARKSRVLPPEEKEKFMKVLKGSVDAFLDKEKK